jgi:hypothetical protein
MFLRGVSTIPLLIKLIKNLHYCTRNIFASPVGSDFGIWGKKNALLLFSFVAF